MSDPQLRVPITVSLIAGLVTGVASGSIAYARFADRVASAEQRQERIEKTQDAADIERQELRAQIAQLVAQQSTQFAVTAQQYTEINRRLGVIEGVLVPYRMNHQ